MINIFQNDELELMKGEQSVIKIRPGVYRHFKGKEYRVLFVAKHSETEESMVVYQALYGEYGYWVRPASMWNEMVDHDGEKLPRFQWVRD